jgi:uncharacterized protein (TIGR03382 family)
MNARTTPHLGIATALLLTGTASAQIVNGSFEIADPNYPDDPWFSVPLGWTNPLGHEYSGWRLAAWLGFTPADGSFMAVVPGGGWLDQEGIRLNAGDRVVFEYGVDNFDSYRSASAIVSLIGPVRVDFFGPEVPVGEFLPGAPARSSRRSPASTHCGSVATATAKASSPSSTTSASSPCQVPRRSWPPPGSRRCDAGGPLDAERATIRGFRRTGIRQRHPRAPHHPTTPPPRMAPNRRSTMNQQRTRIIPIGALALALIASTANASIVVESSRRTTWALAGTADDGGGLDTVTSTALGPLSLTSRMGPTDFFVEAGVVLDSLSNAGGMSGTVNLTQRGFDDLHYGVVPDRYLAWIWVDHVMTFTVDRPTAYVMQVGTASSTWEVPPIYGLAIAAGAWRSLEDDGLSFLDAAEQPATGVSSRAGVLTPGRYTAFYRFTSAYFGPNSFDLSTGSLSYSLTIPAPGAATLLAASGLAAMRRRRR